jgi:AcrR family transcriptional regulator
MLSLVSTVKRSSRRDQAESTRRGIVGAAHEEFLARGYHGATMAAIARRAGVAVQTVYFVFHTKAQLMSAVIDAAVLGPDPTIPQVSDWWAAMQAANTAADALTHFVRGVGPLLARAAPVSQIARDAALADDEVKAVLSQHDRLQLEGYRQVVDILASKGELLHGLTPETVVDLLLTFCGDGVYVELRIHRGWPHDQVVDWLVATLPLLLLADGTAEGVRGPRP